MTGGFASRLQRWRGWPLVGGVATLLLSLWFATSAILVVLWRSSQQLNVSRIPLDVWSYIQALIFGVVGVAALRLGAWRRGDHDDALGSRDAHQPLGRGGRRPRAGDADLWPRLEGRRLREPVAAGRSRARPFKCPSAPRSRSPVGPSSPPLR